MVHDGLAPLLFDAEPMSQQHTRPPLPIIDQSFWGVPQRAVPQPSQPSSAVHVLRRAVPQSARVRIDADVDLDRSPNPNAPREHLADVDTLHEERSGAAGDTWRSPPYLPKGLKPGRPFRYSKPDLVYAPVELGTVRIGHLEERENSAPRPVQDDHFRITTLIREDGRWLEDPLQAELLNALPPAASRDAPAKLREIPIRLSYDSPDLVCRTRYEAFDNQTGRSVCASVGSGEARRLNDRGGIDDVKCTGPEGCDFANSPGVRCKLLGRVHFEIEGQAPNVENNYIFRSASINSLRNLEARLARFWALFGGRLRGVPFRLLLRSRTTLGSRWSRFFCVDLELRHGVSLIDAKRLADEEARAMGASGLDYEAWEEIIRAGLANGALVGDDHEAMLVREFFEDACERRIGRYTNRTGPLPSAGAHLLRGSLLPAAGKEHPRTAVGCSRR